MNKKTKLPRGFKSWVNDTQYEHPMGHKLRPAINKAKTVGGIYKHLGTPTKTDKEYTEHLLKKFKRDRPVHTKGGWRNTK